MFEKARLRRPSPGTVLGGLALFVAISGAAVAAIPSGNGTLTACIPNNGGGIRVIDSEGERTCKGGQTMVQLATPAAKVADAENLDGLDSTAFLRSDAAAGGDLTGTYPHPVIGAGKITSTHFAAGSKAPNADQLDDLDSSEFLRVNGKAADADKLDGVDSTGFVRGGGTVTRQVVGVNKSARNTTTPAGLLAAFCGRGHFTVQYQNTGGSPSWLWVVRDGVTVAQQVAPLDAPIFYSVSTGTRRATIHARRGTNWTLWDLFLFADGTQCRIELTQTTS